MSCVHPPQARRRHWSPSPTIPNPSNNSVGGAVSIHSNASKPEFVEDAMTHYIVESHDSQQLDGCAAGPGAFAAFVGLVFGACVVWMTGGKEPLALLFVAGGGFFVFFGLSSVAYVLRRRRLWRLFGVAKLSIPDGASFCLGETRPARFTRTGGEPRARQAPLLSAALVCTEWISYRRGTTNHTSAKEVNRIGLSITANQLPEAISGRVLIQVPPAVQPSVFLPSHRLIWTVEVVVRVAGLPDDKKSFTITVLPSIVAGAGR
jgi:hypothetical protein